MTVIVKCQYWIMLTTCVLHIKAQICIVYTLSFTFPPRGLLQILRGVTDDHKPSLFLSLNMPIIMETDIITSLNKIVFNLNNENNVELDIKLVVLD